MWAMDTGQLIIDFGITNYLKGGLDTLAVGNSNVNVSNIVQQSVDHLFTIEEIY